MKYTLMHKNIPVMDLEIGGKACAIQKTGRIYAPEHIPLGALSYRKKLNKSALNRWWQGRSIPADRQGVREAMAAFGVSAPQGLLEKSLGLSLSDQYWIRPEGMDISWEEFNFFENRFSEDVGNALLGKGLKYGAWDMMSPDITTNGCLKKMWKIIGGRRWLFKGGESEWQQEPFNEVLATEIMERIGTIDFVPYSLIWENDMPYSVCGDFVTKDTEFIPAADLMRALKQPNHLSDYEHFIKCCGFLGIPDAEESIGKMLAVDCLIANDDRHLHNFGAVRNAETLEWLGLAPVFDCGTSMWGSQPTSRINTENVDTPSKPFRKSHAEQIKLVTSFDWLKPETLKDIDGLCCEVFQQNPYMDEYRRDKLCRAIAMRAESLLEIIEQQAHGQRTSTGEMKLI